MKPAAAALAAFVLVYLLAGFVVWDWNPANWTELGRFIVALFGTSLAVVTATAPWEMK
jgi:hypothetical protein